jgi:3-oxoadipate enol-lactonase
VHKGGMVPVWEMTDKLWFTDTFADAASDDYHAVREVMIGTPVEGYLCGTSAVASLAYRDQLHRITAPTHIIAAGADVVTPIERSTEIHNRIAGSTLDIIAGQRHFSNVEEPDVFNIILRRGLDEMTTEDKR